MMTSSSGDLSLAGMFVPQQTVSSIACCNCGLPTPPNMANMCAACLRNEFNIADKLVRHERLIHCPECRTWLQHPRTWIRADLESRELLAHCLHQLKRKNRKAKEVRITNAEFIWTEPHSKRIKLLLTVEGEAIHGVLLQVKHQVEFVQQDRLCDQCSRAQASPDQWVASVQLRQHVPHRRTFLFLEQQILKHGAAARALRIKEADRGLDFFFSNRSHAQSFVDFINDVTPIRYRSDKQLVSHDPKSNVYNYKHTFSVEICPICREDLICLPPKVANSLGNLGPLVVCTKVSNKVLLLDPFTLRHVFLSANQFWRDVFRPMLTSRQLVEYIVLNVVEKLPEVDIAGSRYCLARVEVARVSDFGVNDIQFDIKTHIGHLLKEGDIVLGYDLYGANINDSDIDKYKGLELPYAILIKKSYEDKRRGKPRKWKLKRLDMDVDNTGRGRGDQERRNTDYEEFLRDLEENPDSRFNVSLYRNKEYEQNEMASSVGEDDQVPLDKLLAELELSDEEEEGNDGMAE